MEHYKNDSVKMYLTGYAYLAILNKEPETSEHYNKGDLLIKFSIIFSKLLLKPGEMINPLLPNRTRTAS